MWWPFKKKEETKVIYDPAWPPKEEPLSTTCPACGRNVEDSDKRLEDVHAMYHWQCALDRELVSRKKGE